MKASEPKQEGNATIVTVEGKLDAVSAPELDKILADYVQKGHHRLLLNFSGVEYLSSAGMRLLLSLTKKLHSLDGKLVVFALHPDVEQVLREAGLHLILHLYPTQATALLSLS